jgi:two-component system phosphate regulon response regulator PhoB
MSDSTTQKQILLLEDEVASAMLLKEYLQISGFKVRVVHDGEEAMSCINEGQCHFDLAILDIMVPPPDGYEVCRQLRANPAYVDIPVIFLSAKDREDDEIIGLEVGADDYITKPAGGKLVATRVRKLLDRKAEEPDHILRNGPFKMDTLERTFAVEDQEIEFTTTEFEIMQLFMRNPRRVFTRQEILDRIASEDRTVFDRTVDAHIKNLRLKLGEDLGANIRTYRGLGYGLKV